MGVMLGVIIGIVGGVIFACYCQFALEQKYIETGIARLNGDYYRIEKISKNE